MRFIKLMRKQTIQNSGILRFKPAAIYPNITDHWVCDELTLSCGTIQYQVELSLFYNRNILLNFISDFPDF